jgi:G:T-mismatch repair DNA endonuclease (very short patch repair protein)
MIEGINKWHQSSNGISFHKTLSNKLNHSKGPNKLEQVFLNILNSWGFKFTFIGDGSEWIGNKNPDFINGNKIIDLFGEFWHKNDTDYKISKRINYLKSFGYDAIIVWSKELKDKEKLRIKIEEFVNG